MKDPVTTVTGITYDRESIEQWLTTSPVTEDAAAAVVCPVTKQPLPRGSDLTPNHVLRRLIQEWCVANTKSGIDRIPTPKSPVRRSYILRLVRDVNNCNDASLNLAALEKLEELANEGDKNQKSMAEAGVSKAMVSFVLRCFKDVRTLGLDRALRILRLTWTASTENKQIVEDNMDFVESILWILSTDIEDSTKTLALVALKNVAEIASWSLMKRLNLNFYDEMVTCLRRNISAQATRGALQTLTRTSAPGNNKAKLIEAGAVHELIELELSNPDKRTTELVFCLLAHLCSCADGRQQLLKHAGGVTVVSKRLLRVSPATDDRALCIMESIARFSATRGVVSEILRVGGVSKLCIVLQADCAGHLKKKARKILRLHARAWSNSPCIQVVLWTRDPRY